MTNGHLQSYGVFWCDHCKQEVEKRISVGLEAKSCGCYRNILISESNNFGDKHHSYTHGDTKNRLYKIYTNMKQRCSNINFKFYKDYGGRGIIVCPEWANDYTKFRDWSLNNGYQEGLEIDQIDNNGNYEPSNCRWVTHKQNTRNRRTTKLNLEIANEIKTLYKTNKYTQRQLAKKYEVGQSIICSILNNKNWRD